MRQSWKAIAGLRLVPWAVAGVLLISIDAPVSASDAATARVIETEAEAITSELLAPVAEGGVGGLAPSSTPAANPGIATSGTGPMGLGALVGAGVAAVYALRERFKSR